VQECCRRRSPHERPFRSFGGGGMEIGGAGEVEGEVMRGGWGEDGRRTGGGAAAAAAGHVPHIGFSYR